MYCFWLHFVRSEPGVNFRSVRSAANQSHPVWEAFDLSGFVQLLVSARQSQPVAEAHASLQTEKADVKRGSPMSRVLR